MLTVTPAAEGTPRTRRRALQTSPQATSAGTRAGEDSPKTPEEAARKFEKVLVQQFTKVMTENMFSNSMAGEGGGKWMESQRDRQREHVTDMITEQLVESNALGISEKLMQKWNVTGGAGKTPNPPSGEMDVPLDLPAAPAELPSRLPSTSPNESHIDHAA